MKSITTILWIRPQVFELVIVGIGVVADRERRIYSSTEFSDSFVVIADFFRGIVVAVFYAS
jgi:hypothetical protein